MNPKLKKLVEKKRANKTASQEEQKMERLLRHVKKLQGEPGEPGYTPERGKDYWTKEDQEAITSFVFKQAVAELVEMAEKMKKDIKSAVRPIKGVDYHDGEPGKTPVKGKDYFDGKDGKMPMHRWVEKALQFQKEDGTWGKLVKLVGEPGKKGDTGPVPEHQVDGLKIRWKQPNGKWGKWIDFSIILQGIIRGIMGSPVASTATGGATTFLGLSDTPDTYSGNGSKGVRVNAGGTALEFYTIGAGTGDMEKSVYDPNDDGVFAIAQGGTGATTASAARTALGLAIGSDVQAFNAILADLAGLTQAANKGFYFDSNTTASTYDLTAFALTLLDDADATAARSTLGLVIGTNVQAYDAELAALAGLVSAADRLPYFTGSGTASLATFTAAARSVLDDATVGDMRTTLGVAIGSNVQAWDADLDAIAALSPTNDDILQRKAGAWTNRTMDQLVTDLALVAADISDFNTAVRTNRLDQMAAPTASVSMNSQLLTNVLDPVSAQDAATKAYVDAAIQGLDIKASVRAASTANLTLSGEQTIDGVSVVAGDRVLVKDQSTGAENGIYVAAAGAWARAGDANTSAEVTTGMFVFVSEGTVNADSGWVLTTNDAITLGTTALVFAQFSGAGQITAGDGLAKSGNTLSVNVDASTIEINADTLRVKAGGILATHIGDAELAALAGLTSAADKLPYFTGAGTAAVTSFTAFARSILDDADEATFKATVNLEIGVDVQAYDAQLADIAGLTPTDNGVIIGNGSNFVVESGATLKTSLGLTIGTDVQAYDADLTTLATAFTSASASGPASLALHEDTDNGTNKVTLTAPTSIASDKTITFQDVTGTVYVTGGTDVAVADGGTGSSTAAGAATNLGLGTGDSPQFTAVNIGHASDSTLTRVSAGVIAIEGVTILTVAGGTLTGDITLGENTSIALDPAGSADGKYSGITVTGTAGAALAFGDLIYLDPTDSRWELADANAAAAADGDARGILGMCVLAAAGDGSATKILLQGIIRADAAFPAMTIGAPLYVSETAGDVVVTQPTTTDVVIRIVGVAITADEMFFRPDFTWVTHT